MENLDLSSYDDYKNQSEDSLFAALRSVLQKKSKNKDAAQRNLIESLEHMLQYEKIHKETKVVLAGAKGTKKEKQANDAEFIACIRFLDAVAQMQAAMVTYSIAHGVLLDKAVKTFIEVRKGEYEATDFDNYPFDLVENIDKQAVSLHIPELENLRFEVPTKSTTPKAVKEGKATNTIDSNLEKYIKTLGKDNWKRKAKKLHQNFPHYFPIEDVEAIKLRLTELL